MSPSFLLFGFGELSPFSFLGLLWESTLVRLGSLATKLSLRFYRFFLYLSWFSAALYAFY